MGVRTFPEEPEFESPAERVVWESLKGGLPSGSVLIANQRFTTRKGDVEADLIVGVPGAGFAVVEVKGGTVTHDGRTWRQSGGKAVNRAIKPIDQGRRAKYALRDYLDEHRETWGRRSVVLAHLVAFPFSEVPADFAAPDCPRWMVIDHDQVETASVVLLDAMRQQDEGRPPPDEDDVERMVECLFGRGLPQRDLVAGVRERAAECDLLTGKQAKVLDLVRSLHRVEIRGGAGCGKTWLAVEQARRLAKKGQRVGLLCYSRGLGAYLRRRVELLPRRERPAYVGTFHHLGVGWGAAPGRVDDPTYYEHDLPVEMASLAAHLSDVDRFDAFVVDEAQDFADAWWPALLAGLRDPERGGVFAFSDEGQRVFARFGRPPVDLVPLELDENLRNTKQIAATFGSLTHAQMRYRGGDGVPVRFVPCRTDDAVTAADDEAVALLDAGWAAVDVALLTTGHRHPVQKERQDGGADGYWASYWEGDDLFYGHVLGFKGLERPAVVLAVNGFRDRERAREMLYVGLSRARDLLVVCGDPDEIRAVGGDGVADRLGIAG